MTNEKTLFTFFASSRFATRPSSSRKKPAACQLTMLTRLHQNRCQPFFVIWDYIAMTLSMRSRPSSKREIVFLPVWPLRASTCPPPSSSRFLCSLQIHIYFLQWRLIPGKERSKVFVSVGLSLSLSFSLSRYLSLSLSRLPPPHMPLINTQPGSGHSFPFSYRFRAIACRA